MDRHNPELKKLLYKCIMANTSAIWQQAAHTTYKLSSPSCSTRAIQKSLTHSEKYQSFLERERKVRRMDHKQKNGKTERARGLGRATRETTQHKTSLTKPTSQTPRLPSLLTDRPN